MIVIARLVAATPIGEKMAAIEVFEQSRCLFVSGERDGIGRRNRWWNRRQHQDALILGFRTAEDLAGEVLEDVVLALAERLVEGRAAAAKMLAQKH